MRAIILRGFQEITMLALYLDYADTVYISTKGNIYWGLFNSRSVKKTGKRAF
ncbi:MAG: hypothetical protein JZD40_01825 [Sulfolobus sp.]|nr:hypothetical protein [Sulfolobus sp.]